MTRTDATNHTGWNVEMYDGSWYPITNPTSLEKAKRICKHWKAMDPTKEFRVYEAIEEKK